MGGFLIDKRQQKLKFFRDQERPNQRGIIAIFLFVWLAVVHCDIACVSLQAEYGGAGNLARCMANLLKALVVGA